MEIHILYIYLWFNLNPSFTNLQQRAEFFSLPYKSVYINEKNSELTEGTESEGIINTTLEISDIDIHKKFTLTIEGEAIRSWNYYIDNYTDYVYPVKILRIELILNGLIYRILNYSEVPTSYYYSRMEYDRLKLSENNSTFSYIENYKASRYRESLKIRLITKHIMNNGKKIFSDFFIKDHYQLTICSGNPEYILYSTGIALFLVWYLSIVIIILKKNALKLINLFKYLKRQFYSEFNNDIFKGLFRLYKKLENRISMLVKFNKI